MTSALFYVCKKRSMKKNICLLMCILRQSNSTDTYMKVYIKFYIKVIHRL